MDERKCNARGCGLDLDIYPSADQKVCLFHADKDKKGKNEDEFNHLFNSLVKSGVYKFEDNSIGQLPTGFFIKLSNATFYGKATFNNYNFERDVFFAETIFYETATFYRCTFSEKVRFIKCSFKGSVNFQEAAFNGQCAFLKCNFEDSVNFRWTTFNRGFLFHENQIHKTVDLSRSIYSSDGQVIFQDVMFMAHENKANGHDYPQMIFNGTKFNELITRFENIKIDDKIKSLPSILFRFCQLKDVYFINCDMSIISFYTSIFDNSIILGPHWRNDETDKLLFWSYNRKNRIAEDWMWQELEKPNSNKDLLKLIWDLKLFSGYNDLALLYRRFKTSLDRTKDYQEASWAYFNEFEMKRRGLLDEKGRILNLRAYLYYLYKVFAGYGEKPLWSMMWLAFSIASFSVINLLLGIKMDGAELSWLDSLLFTIYRIFPTNYFPNASLYSIPKCFFTGFMVFLNTAITLTFLTFTLVGLKRHFRRF
jgi:hypothetical protein